MSIRLVVCLLFLTVSFQTASARLGEAEAYLTGRYGEPRSSHKVDENIKEIQYHSDGWGIRVQMLNGVCQWISYTKTPFYENYDEVRDKLMEANGHGSAWIFKKSPEFIRFPSSLYVRDDNGAFAYIPKQSTFRGEFYTLAWVEYGNAKEAAKKAPKPLPNF